MKRSRAAIHSAPRWSIGHGGKGTTSMHRISITSALLTGSALLLSMPAMAAQDPPAAEATEPDASDATADATIASAGQLDAAQAQIELLQAQIEALQTSVESLRAQVTKQVPSWKGAPQLEDKEAGWSFKPRGRLMYDFATVGAPDGYSNAGLGFSNEVRRARLGVEGSVPGGFGYKFELDFAPGDVEFTDALLSYKAGDAEFIVGQHNNFQSLDELTSSLHSSFIERAAFTDAFGFERRVGASVQYTKGDLLAQLGAFTDSINDLNNVGDDNNSYGVDGRLVFAPKMGSNQLHFAGSAHWRELNDAATTVRYRQRPAVHTTDVRFVDTGNISGATSETGYGLEAAGIFGPFHLASEAYWQQVGRIGSLTKPTFFGGYIEAGYFLTGESRGYKGGKFDRVKVLKPVGKDGWGSLGFNLRWDYLDLTDGGFIGGTQNAYQASLNWKPTDYVLFGLNYAHILYNDAAISVSGDRDYSVDMAALRAQVDF
ncbi:MAG TPA: porin [Sphingomicrobium sp.]|nr:porin [Sphingomicrobium sp.]